MARNPATSLVRSVAGAPATRPTTRLCARTRANLRAELGGRAGRVDDQPRAVDLLQGVGDACERDDLRRLGVDVVALEVQRRLVPVQADPNLVRRRVGLPVM